MIISHITIASVAFILSIFGRTLFIMTSKQYSHSTISLSSHDSSISDATTLADSNDGTKIDSTRVNRSIAQSSSTSSSTSSSHIIINDFSSSTGSTSSREHASPTKQSRKPTSGNVPESAASKPTKAKRHCVKNLDMDWKYKNIYTVGGEHGHKRIGSASGSMGACSLM